MLRPIRVIASEAKQSMVPQVEEWIASSLALLSMTVTYNVRRGGIAIF
ncbi:MULTISPECIES: hypothetical protein [unclassified Bradyrhizobium]